ncbi:MAG: TIM barrel protein, partial [Planctomycetales bacterium]|nr:TIM barrel protein [Planctomycetales bacterium]
MAPAEREERWPLGVFASIDAGFGVRLEVARCLRVPTMHLHAPRSTPRTEQTAREFRRRIDPLGMRITVVFAGFAGESYADIPTTAATVGLVPEETRAARAQEMKEISDFARTLGCNAVGLHIGFVPEDRDCKSYRGLLDCTRELLDHVAGNDQNLHLETGQESADHLLEFIADVDRPNLRINFDPANMIL